MSFNFTERKDFYYNSIDTINFIYYDKNGNEYFFDNENEMLAFIKIHDNDYYFYLINFCFKDDNFIYYDFNF